MQSCSDRVSRSTYVRSHVRRVSWRTELFTILEESQRPTCYSHVICALRNVEKQHMSQRIIFLSTPEIEKSDIKLMENKKFRSK